MTTTQPAGHVAVIGATSWGTTLALLMARRGVEVRLLARTGEEARAIDDAREHSQAAARIPLPRRAPRNRRLGRRPEAAAAALFVVPSHTMRENARRAAPSIDGARSSSPPAKDSNAGRSSA